VANGFGHSPPRFSVAYAFSLGSVEGQGRPDVFHEGSSWTILGLGRPAGENKFGRPLTEGHIPRFALSPSLS